MPEVYCQFLKRKVDGGYCAFVCDHSETEKKISYNPFRGIQTGCIYSKELLEEEPISEKAVSKIKKRK